MHKAQVQSNLYLRLCNVHATVIICPQTLWPRGFFSPLHKAQMFGVVHATVLFVLKHFEFWAWICKLLRSLGIDSARLCSLAGRYVKQGCRTGPPGWESILGLLNRFTDSGSGFLSTLDNQVIMHSVVARLLLVNRHCQSFDSFSNSCLWGITT